MTDLIINKVPSLTWHFLKMNDARVRWQEPLGAADTDAAGADELYTDNSGSQGYFPADDTDVLFSADTARVSVTAGENETITARVCFDDCGESRSAQLCVNAAKGSSVTVFVTLKGCSYLAFRSKTVVSENADVKLVLTELTESGGRLITDSDAYVGEKGKLSMLRFCPGTAGTYAQSRVLLKGDESSLFSRTSYLGCESQKLDMNYVIAHIGKRTSCDIAANGALDDNASKTFRGTIDFRCGSSGSFGNETENVLLLGDNIENKTLPIILCDEEDVCGNHGATIGKISEESLLYFASRGISPEQAERLLTLAISDAFCRMVGDDELTQLIKARTEGDDHD